MQWSGRNEILQRNNLEDAEVAVKKPNLRVWLGKAGCNGRDVMRFYCVIILFETVSCLKPVARRVRQSRPSSRRDAFGRDELRPSPGLSRQPQARREAEADTLSALAPHLPFKICIPVTSLPASQDLHSRNFHARLSRSAFPCEARAAGDTAHAHQKASRVPFTHFLTSP